MSKSLKVGEVIGERGLLVKTGKQKCVKDIVN